jgi:murein DD-endopeptidase MepM/ murein hydrolase activator NlpD
MRRIAGIFATVLLGLLLLAPDARAQAEAPPALQMVERQLKEVFTQLVAQRRRLGLVRRKERRLLGELEGIDRTKEQAERRLAELVAESHQTKTRARGVAVQLAQTNQLLQLRKSRLGARLRDVYKYGRTGYLDVLLGADDFTSFIVHWHRVATVVSADAAAIESYRLEAVRRRQLQTTLSDDQAYLRALTADAVARRQEIVTQERTKRTMLRRIQTERAAYERMVRELEVNSRDLGVMIRGAQAPPLRPHVAEARTPFGFMWPARGAITSGFGLRRHPVFGIMHIHTGVDIAAVWGSPVLAAADGRVIYAGWFGGYGKIVVIDHGQGVSTLYGHLSQSLVPSGDEVHRGQVIARVGNTGYSTGPHIHFEVRINGTPVDPEGF